MDTVLLVGHRSGCGAVDYICTSSNDDACLSSSGVAGTGSRVNFTYDGVSTGQLEVIVGGYAGVTGPYNLSVRVVQAPMVTPSRTPTATASGVSPTRTRSRSLAPSASPTVAPQCAGYLNGLAGFVGGSTAVQSLPDGGGHGIAYANCMSVSTAYNHRYILDLGPNASGLTNGESIVFSTCGYAFWDTMIHVFDHDANYAQPPNSTALCNTGTAGSLTCLASSDDSCGAQSHVTLPVNGRRYWAVLMGGFGTATGAYQMLWSVNGASAISSGSRTFSLSPSMPPSQSPSTSRNPSWSPTSTRVPSRSAQSTPVGNGACVERVSGYSGTVRSANIAGTPGSTDGFNGMWMCGALVRGTAAVIAIDVGAAAVVNPGVVLVMSTCPATFDTVIVSGYWAGFSGSEGCFQSASSFQCAEYNDDVISAVCPSSGASSVARVPLVPGRSVYYAVVTTFNGNSGGTFDLSWRLEGVSVVLPTLSPMASSQPWYGVVTASPSAYSSRSTGTGSQTTRSQAGAIAGGVAGAVSAVLIVVGLFVLRRVRRVRMQQRMSLFPTVITVLPSSGARQGGGGPGSGSSAGVAAVASGSTGGSSESAFESADASATPVILVATQPVIAAPVASSEAQPTAAPSCMYAPGPQPAQPGPAAGGAPVYATGAPAWGMPSAAAGSDGKSSSSRERY